MTDVVEGRAAVDEAELVLLVLRGVQAFVSESRSTSDLRNASEVVSELALVAAATLRSFGHVVLPHSDGGSNKLVAVVPANRGEEAVGEVRREIDARWRTQVRRVFGSVAVDRGFPDVVGVWVRRKPGESGWAWWARAHVELSMAKRARVVKPAQWSGRRVCAVSPQWPVSQRDPVRVVRHEEPDRGTLSQQAWVKRVWHRLHHRDRFASTRSIASAPFRARLAGLAPAVDEPLAGLHTQLAVVDAPRERELPGVPDSVRGLGPWLDPEAWMPPRLQVLLPGLAEHELTGIAIKAADLLRTLYDIATAAGITQATSYLAVVMQDVDSLGRRLGRLDFPDEHHEVGALLSGLGGRQREIVAGLAPVGGQVVYAGGDDLMAFTPAIVALEAARQLRADVTERLSGGPWRVAPTASTAVVFFHASYPLQRAVLRARVALQQAKARADGRKNGLAVVVLRRSGERVSSVQSWASQPYLGEPDPELVADPVSALLTMRDAVGGLAGGLAAELERDRAALDRLGGRFPELARVELSRRARHHQATEEQVAALLRLAYHESAGAPDATSRWNAVPALLVARFLQGEAR